MSKKQYEIVGEVYWIPLTDIYVDLKFNCRSRFTYKDVYELGQSIREEGQKMPLLIQPIDDVPLEEQPNPCPWEFRLVAGHRRHAAIDAWTPLEHAKCIIEKGLSKQQAYTLNFTENLQRSDLNMLEEAKAIERNWPDWEVVDISRVIGKPRRWVKTRLDLLTLPEYVQRRAAIQKGGITQYDVEVLANVPPDAVEQTFQAIVTGKTDIQTEFKRRPTVQNRPRGKVEVEGMIELIYKSYKWSRLSEEDRNLVVSTLAWVAKGITSKEFMEERLAYPKDSVMIDKDDKVKGFKNE